MQSHRDADGQFRQTIAKQFMQELQGRAEKIAADKKSTLAYGADGEPILAEWTANGVGIRNMPDDPQGILRISIGGGDHLPVHVNYCTFRGARGKCIDLLRKALKALETDPEN